MDPVAVVGLGYRVASGEEAASLAPILHGPAAKPDPHSFDHEFFGISALEAAGIPHYERLLLELAWEALEDAGQPPGRIAGTAVGLFVDRAWVLASARLMQFLDLRGPLVLNRPGSSLIIETLRLAGGSLRRGESVLALAGGSLGHGGAAFLVLKPLSAAREGGDSIRAILDENGVLTFPDHQAASPQSSPAALLAPRAHLLPLSARTPEALIALARRWEDFLQPAERRDPLHLSDLCYTAAVRREHLEHRLALVVRSSQDLRRGLRDFIERRQQAGVSRGQALGRKPVFVFSGQTLDAPLPDLAWLQDEAKLAEHFERARAAMHLASTQGVRFALQIALAKLWRDWGVQPDALLGCGSGDLAAAHDAGDFDVEQAATALRLESSNLGWRSSLTASIRLRTPSHQRFRRTVQEPLPLPLAVKYLAERGHDVFIEIGADATVCDLIRDSLRQLGLLGVVVSSLRRSEPAHSALVSALGALFVRGQHVAWERLYPSGRCLRLPAYPWQRRPLPELALPGRRFSASL